MNDQNIKSHSLPQMSTAPTLDRTLLEVRSGRQLEKICSSVESFLCSQLTRLEDAVNQCQLAMENDRIVKQVLADFESNKRTWEEQRACEMERLNQASNRLAQGWVQLENERRLRHDENDKVTRDQQDG